MNAIEQTRSEISVHLERVIHLLGNRAPAASVFFREVLSLLQRAREEDDLINTFIALSTTGFQGFEFPEGTLEAIDDLLANAERIAHTFMASESARH